jgi:hypothetical protein
MVLCWPFNWLPYRIRPIIAYLCLSIYVPVLVYKPIIFPFLFVEDIFPGSLRAAFLALFRQLFKPVRFRGVEMVLPISTAANPSCCIHHLLWLFQVMRYKVAEPRHASSDRWAFPPPPPLSGAVLWNRGPLPRFRFWVSPKFFAALVPSLKLNSLC